CQILCQSPARVCRAWNIVWTTIVGMAIVEIANVLNRPRAGEKNTSAYLQGIRMSDSSPRPHILVIGGGPAGTTAATLLAQRGYRVELFERERFPRFHIGESLIPQTYWVLKRLNMLDKMRGSHFVKKYSVQFVNQYGKLSEPFYFVDHKPHESSQTWQVSRA